RRANEPGATIDQPKRRIVPAITTPSTANEATPSRGTCTPASGRSPSVSDPTPSGAASASASQVRCRPAAGHVEPRPSSSAAPAPRLATATVHAYQGAKAGPTSYAQPHGAGTTARCSHGVAHASPSETHAPAHATGSAARSQSRVRPCVAKRCRDSGPAKIQPGADRRTSANRSEERRVG